MKAKRETNTETNKPLSKVAFFLCARGGNGSDKEPGLTGWEAEIIVGASRLRGPNYDQANMMDIMHLKCKRLKPRWRRPSQKESEQLRMNTRQS